MAAIFVLPFNPMLNSFLYSLVVVLERRGERRRARSCVRTLPLGIMMSDRELQKKEAPGIMMSDKELQKKEAPGIMMSDKKLQ
nr:hypothetical protein BaRGS_022213 [Batillaria attramentaria]